MPTKLDPTGDRVEACHRAALKLVADNGGTVNKAAKALGVSQQTLNSLVSKRKLGIEFADQLASLYETTVDGLVWRFLRGGEGAVRAKDITGWANAVAEAAGQWPEYAEFYGAAAETVLPVAPRVATPELARDIARLLYDHARKSQVRLTAQRARV